jgi:hypothetical protein
MFQKGLQTIAWKAEDDDEDHLTYTLLFRREGESAWRELRPGLPESIFVWDTTTVADGRYVVRVRASDARSNPGDRGLTGDRDSDPIEVDNTPPSMTIVMSGQGPTSRLQVRVVDARSPVQALEYSIAGGGWVTVYPADGLADSPDERFELPLGAGVNAADIVIRASDALRNTVSQPAAR